MQIKPHTKGLNEQTEFYRNIYIFRSVLKFIRTYGCSVGIENC